MKIRGIDVTGEAGQELMRMVHEAMGFCAHVWGERNEGGYYPCTKCDEQAVILFTAFGLPKGMPKYLNSLDAYKKIWEKIQAYHAITGEKYNTALCEIAISLHRPIWDLYPHHHLEALASVLRVECEECGGSGEKHCKTCLHSSTDYTCSGGIGDCLCKPCQGEGTRTILDIWEARYGK
jgi:hypothetical protein